MGVPSFFVSRLHRTARNEDRGDVDPQCTHEHPRDDLVAVGDTDEAVEFVGVHHGLDAVGDQLAAGEAVKHPVVPHRNPVVDADGVELKRYPARFADRFFDDTAVFLEEKVPRDNVDVRIRHPDERFVEVLVFEPRRTEETPVGGFVKSSFDRIAAHRDFLCSSIFMV